MDNQNKVIHTPFASFDPNVVMYSRWTGPNNILIPYEYEGWIKETMSWKESCYISTNLSGDTNDVRVRGKDAEKLFSDIFVNNFSIAKFPVGKGKHLIACSEKGTILAHGVCMRTAEDEFSTCGSSMKAILDCSLKNGKYDATFIPAQFTGGVLIQLAGPKALEIVENAAEMDIHDLKFMQFMPAEIAGKQVRILRMGMGGTIAYEVHASVADTQAVYNHIVEVGTRYGAQRMGHLAYMCNHTENGFPQVWTHFIIAYEDDDAMLNYYGLDKASADQMYAGVEFHGSMSDMGLRAYYANPIELGWGKMISWDHDFKGKDALRAIMDDPKTRQICTLEWNSDDILNIFRAYYDTEDNRMPDLMVYPQNYFFGADGNLADKVLNDKGELIGRSSGVVFTRYYKKTISQCLINPEYKSLGTEVTVLWGTAGTRQIPIRAKVARYPYLEMPANINFDINSIPRYSK